MSESKSQLTPLGGTIVIALGAVPVLIAWIAAIGLAQARGAALLPAGVIAAMGLVLPALALSSAWQDRLMGIGAGLLFWGLVVLTAMPMYFPGERAQGLSIGWSLLSGQTVSDSPADWAMDVDGVLPGDAGEASMEADGIAVVEPVDTGSFQAMTETSKRASIYGTLEVEDDDLVLPYAADENSLVIPVTLEGPDRNRLEIEMTYDTGATLTTLNFDTLLRLGIAVPANSPVIELRTAAGPRRAQLVLLDGLWLGHHLVEGVTVSVCEECANRLSVGLLGLNATGQFRVVVDQRTKSLILSPRRDQPDQLANVEPWVELKGAVIKERRNGAVRVDLTLHNQSRRDITEAMVSVRCGKSWPIKVGAIPAHGSTQTSMKLSGNPQCDTYQLELVKAWW